MVDTDRKLKLLRARVAALAVSPETIARAEEILRANRMTAGVVDSLRREWLNDMLSHPDVGEARLAASNPDAHFLRWIEARSRKRHHVTRRTVEQVAAKYGSETASKLAIVIWPQEIAWAQRMRLDPNPFTATRAALFLRETEGNPSKTFTALADIYSDAVMRVGYLDNPVQDLTAEEIRFSDDLPEFAPLFQRYAARAYSERLENMTRERVEQLAARAAADENNERRLYASATVARLAVKSPMRRTLSVIRTAMSFGIDSNSTYLLEQALLRGVRAGEVAIEPGQRSADGAFLRLLADADQRKAVLAMEPLPSSADYMGIWEIANLDASFIDTLPPSFKALACTKSRLEAWQEEIVECTRPCPYDAVSDLGFYLLGA